MKKTICKLLAIAIAMFVFVAPMTAMAAQPITITSVTDNGDMTATITWDNPNGGAVTVGSLVYDDGDAGNRIMVEFDVAGNSYTYRNLAPGLEYLLLVFPGTDLGNAGIELYSVPMVDEFDDFYFKVLEANLAYFVLKGDSYSYNYAADLSNRKIYDMLNDKDFWVKIDFDHITYTNAFTFPALTVVTAPTGYVITTATEVEIPEYTTGFWKTMVYMNDALATMHEEYGEIPVGKYDVKVYLDGRFAGESSFNVKGE